MLDPEPQPPPRGVLGNTRPKLPGPAPLPKVLIPLQNCQVTHCLPAPVAFCESLPSKPSSGPGGVSGPRQRLKGPTGRRLWSEGRERSRGHPAPSSLSVGPRPKSPDSGSQVGRDGSGQVASRGSRSQSCPPQKRRRRTPRATCPTCSSRAAAVRTALLVPPDS